MCYLMCVHPSTFESLATKVPLDNFDPTPVANRFNGFINCVKVINTTVVIIQGPERLATASAACLLYTPSHLSVTDQTPGVLGNACRHHGSIFPQGTNTDSLPFPKTLSSIYKLLDSGW